MSRGFRPHPAWTAIFAILGAGGCIAPVSTIEYSLSGPLPPSHLERSQPDFQKRRIQLSGARDETLSFCFSLRALSATRRGLSLIAESPRSTENEITSDAIRLYRLAPIPLHRRPGWYLRTVAADLRDPEPLDVLVPLTAPKGGLPESLDAEIWHHFWGEVRIPRDAAPGEYAGRIVLADTARELAAIPLRLTVWPIEMPLRGTFPVIAELDHRRQTNSRILVSQLREHGLTPVFPDLHPQTSVGPRGEAMVDWSEYDRVFASVWAKPEGSAMLDEGAWPLPSKALADVLTSPGRVSSPTFGEFSLKYLDECVLHFEANRWLSRAFLLMPNPVSLGAAPETGYGLMGQWARSRRCPVPLVVRGFPQDLEPLGWTGYRVPPFGSFVDTWLTPGQFLDPEIAMEEKRSGRSTWLAVDRPPFSGSISIHARPEDVRVLAWQVGRAGASLLYLGQIDNWPSGEGVPRPVDCIRHFENNLLFPGESFGLDEPVLTTRLKYLQRGIQDVAWMSLLTDRGLGHLRDTIEKTMVSYVGAGAYRAHYADGRVNGWPPSWSAFEQARESAASECLAAHGESPFSNGPQSLERGMAWKSVMGIREELSVTVDGTRIRLSGSGDTPSALMECSITVRNHRRTPWVGVASFRQAQAWLVPDDPVAVSIPPHSGRKFVLTATAHSLPVEGLGYVPLSIEFEPKHGAAHRADVRASYLMAQPCLNRPRIDGNLSEWSAGTRNVAADFLWHGFHASPATSAAPPKEATLAFVMCDAQNLYVAINAKAERRTEERREFQRHGTLEYSDLVPMSDDDLVELLVDPTNAGTRTPSDLFHLVIHRGGAFVAEKGLRLNPPVGRWEPLRHSIEYAVFESGDRWTAELQIPLSTFGPEAIENPIWGFNVTRLDAARQEFSTWSGAVGNAYDPLSLGNLHLPNLGP